MPDGRGSTDFGGEPLGRAARRAGRVDWGRQRVPHAVGHEPDGLDHGPRAPHGGGDGDGDRTDGRAARSGAGEIGSVEEGTDMATETQAPAQPTHDQDPIVRDRLYIGGEWVEPHGSGTFEVVASTT